MGTAPQRAEPGRPAVRMTPIGDTEARLIEPHVHADERGAFARTWCTEIFAAAGIPFTPIQGNTSHTRQRGSVRGMHFQRAPWRDAKIVRCSRGRIWDVIVDLRPGSPRRGMPHALELSETNWAMLYVPPGFAHGFQTLSDDVTVEYLMGERYVPTVYDGFRYDDPGVAISWPEPVSAISPADLAWPSLSSRMPGFLASIP
jgi:dTDP-4-dehydrorhamnose 3,5-epimerase